ICSPLYVKARTRDSQSSSWGYHLQWRDPDDKEHTWSCAAEMLNRNGEDLVKHLRAGGLSIKPDNQSQKRLCEYIQRAEPHERMLNVQSVGWHDVYAQSGEVVNSFVLPDANIGPALKETIVIQSRFSSSDERFATTGTIEAWRENLGRL